MVIGMRAAWEESSDSAVVVLAHCRIRFQVRAYWSTKLLRKCATKALPMVDDLRDESDHENPTRQDCFRVPTA